MSKFRFQSGVFFLLSSWDFLSIYRKTREKTSYYTSPPLCVWSVKFIYKIQFAGEGGRSNRCNGGKWCNEKQQNSVMAQRVHHEPWDNIHIYLPSQNVILWWKRRGWIDFLSYSATSMELPWFYDNIRFNRWEKSMENESRLTENILTEFLC